MSDELPPEQPHEYPKAIEVGGVKVTVTSREDELRWRASETVVDPTPAAEPVSTDVPESVLVVGLEPVTPEVLDDPDGVPPADPLDDVSLEMDNATFQPESKTKKAAHKKK